MVRAAAAGQGAGYSAVEGIQNIDGVDDRVVIQGVQMLIEGEARRLRLLFIGRGFEGMGLGDGFAACNSA